MISIHENEIARRRQVFVDLLSTKTNGRLAEPELQSIAENYYFPHNHRHDSSPPEINIIIHEDLRDFTHSATLKRVASIDESEITNAVEENGEWLIGDGVFGVWFDRNLNNDRITANSYTMPIFDFNQLQVNLVQRFASKNKWMQPLEHETSWILNIWLSKIQKNINFRRSQDGG
jgi:hypothetical protein